MTRDSRQWIVADFAGRDITDVKGRRTPILAAEGIPFLIVAALFCLAAYRWLGTGWLLAALGLTAVLFVIFRDPRRIIPAAPLGVLSPVDGRVLEAATIEQGGSGGRALRIRIRIDAAGTYTARSPVEGKVMDLSTADEEAGPVDFPTNALWVRTDEGDDVVLQFSGYRLGLPPKSLVRYGERVGQGARCAYLRLVRLAEIHLPEGGRPAVAPGDRVIAGRDVIARLPQS